MTDYPFTVKSAPVTEARRGDVVLGVADPLARLSDAITVKGKTTSVDGTTVTLSNADGTSTLTVGSDDRVVLVRYDQ